MPLFFIGYTLAKISKKNSGPSGPRDASSSDFFKLQVPFRGKLLELLNIGNYVRSIQESLKKYPLDRASEKVCLSFATFFIVSYMLLSVDRRNLLCRART